MSRRENTGNESGRRVKHRANRGASSSRTRQAPEAEPVVDLLYGYLFDNDEDEHAKFLRHFATRPIIKPKSLDMAFFATEGFDIVAMLGTSHLDRLAGMTSAYSEVMVRAFYHNLSYINGTLQSRVSGVEIVMTAPIWTALLGFDFDAEDRYQYDGDNNVVIDGFNRDEAVYEARRPGGHRSIVSVGQLTVSSRILFYVISHILFPRAHNHSRVLEGDIPVMWAVRHGIPVNWRHYICHIMYKAKQKNGAALPYAYLVQKILEHFHVPMHNEQMISQITWNSRFGQRLLEQCKIAKVRDGVWQYTGVDEQVPDAGHDVPPEVHDDVDADVHMEDIVEPDGGFSLRDVMQAINASREQMSRMEAKQNKRWQTEDERWTWTQGHIKGLEDTLAKFHIGGPVEDDEEDEEDAD